MDRLSNGLALTPQMGWNTYNQYNCQPNETVVKENAQALVDTGLADLGYKYVTIDCGWSVDYRVNGSLTWNPDTFPSGFPAIGDWLHDLGLLFGAYGDSGILLCGSPPNNTGSLYHEDIDAKTFADWGVDSLKYDNCYSDAATNYPNVNYAPSVSPEDRYRNMSSYLQAQDRPILFQVCEWGVDFPALWAPDVGNSWRIGQDIIPHWRSIFRTLNQAAPQTEFAGPGHWPDSDMLLVGLEDVLSVAEEQTHFSLWGILKSPLTIGANIVTMRSESLEILSNEDVISYNQDSLGVSASLKRRYTDQGYEVWSGPLDGDRTVAAVINWRGEDREITLDLADVGLQYAGTLKNVWSGESVEDVKSSYTAAVEAHGVILVELGETVTAGDYPADIFASVNGYATSFSNIYAPGTSSNYTMTITLNEPSEADISIQSGHTKSITAGSTAQVSLSAGYNNLTIQGPSIASIHIKAPPSTYYSSSDFSLSGASTFACPDFCLPTGSKIINLASDSSATATILSSTAGQKYIEIDYINNDVAFATAWDWGSNSRNLTIKVNDADPVRLEVPLTGKHSELDGPGLGWWDSARLGVLTGGWKIGKNEVVLGNEGGEGGFTTWAPDVVGVSFYD